MQAVVWKFNWQRYILQAVPAYLVEGLLAGVGLKIALKFITFTYELPPTRNPSMCSEWSTYTNCAYIASRFCRIRIFVFKIQRHKARSALLC